MLVTHCACFVCVVIEIQQEVTLLVYVLLLRIYFYIYRYAYVLLHARLLTQHSILAIWLFVFLVWPHHLQKVNKSWGALFQTLFFLKLLIFDCSSIFIDLIILKTYSEQFTLTLCVYGVEAMRSRQTTIPFPVGIPRWRVKRNSQRRLHGAVIPTSQCHLRIYWQYFAPCGSKMAVKTTSGYGFDGDFWLVVPGFLLESRLLAVYLHAIGQWRLEHSYCKASTMMHKISKYRQSICDGKILSAKARPVAFSGRETSK